jgi:hypothetical protein
MDRRLRTLSFDDTAAMLAFMDQGFAAPEAVRRHRHSRGRGLGRRSDRHRKGGRRLEGVVEGNEEEEGSEEEGDGDVVGGHRARGHGGRGGGDGPEPTPGTVSKKRSREVAGLHLGSRRRLGDIMGGGGSLSGSGSGSGLEGEDADDWEPPVEHLDDAWAMDKWE